ncbi:hypothetical protein TSUD_251030 [Trifolium subterraneum]|uniref:MaoC-like domain-containing protein n=1 Tax=Trifolium subterraneum TaxID=3900 RepID=A0A2Z6MEL7_TRISU|nr:hypothetical protein TSUD_251030 [Trifolium subterraneum]
MLFRSLHSNKIQYLRQRCFSSATAPHVLKLGDVLKKTRIFTEEDVLEYSKVSHDSNPVHTDSAAARSVGFEGPLVHGMLVASLFPHIISAHFPAAVYVSQTLNFKLPVYIGDQFKTRCFKNGETLVIDGEALALLPTLDYRAVEV